MSMGSKRKRCSERALVRQCLKAVRNRAHLHACCEVPVLGRSADLAYVLDDVLTTVEFKLRDWRKAIVQVQDHMLGADYCYVCMPRRKVSDVMRSELLQRGIGLFFLREDDEWPFEEIIEPTRSEHTWEVARRWAVEYIYENEGRVAWRNKKSVS